jgi:UPF0755 protein
MYKKIFFLFFLLFSALFLIVYKSIFSNNVVINNNGYHVVYIFSNYSYQEVHNLLEKNNIVLNLKTFDWVSRRMNYPNNVKPGRYVINNNLNNRELIAMLRSGKQSPVNLTLSNIYNIEDVASKTGKILEADSIEITKFLNSNEYLAQFSLDSLSVRSRIIPNTYEFYWNTDAHKFITRMISESDKFWNEDRKLKAENLKLSTHEVVTLASIVQMESNKKDEYKRIAGVYLNRLKDNWPLQADPTVKYAIGKPELKRVLKVHTEFDSPYNTYKYLGLPPSPIIFPETYSIDAVLNAEKHNYYFFCAKDDFSGYHTFAKTLSEHNRNAALYHKALNKKDIF